MMCANCWNTSLCNWARTVKTTGGVPRDVMNYRNERVAEWTRAGVSATEIAARLGISTRAVTRYRSRAGLTQRQRPPMTPEQLSRALALLNDGCSTSETARTIGYSYTAIRRRFPGRSWSPEQIYEHVATLMRYRHQEQAKRKKTQRTSV